MQSLSSDMEFVGLAGEKFDTLQDLANFSLGKYWFYDWANQSFMITPVFHHENHGYSDQDIEKAIAKKKSDKHQSENKDSDQKTGNDQDIAQTAIEKRQAENAEKLLYDAVCELIRDLVKHPFIAIHNLNINDHANRLSAILQVDKSQLPGELDFLIIGPLFGILHIEVKSSAFVGKNDFRIGSSYLPHEYKKGLKQLLKSSGFLSILEKYIGRTAPAVKRVLLTPNLEKKRFDDWFQSWKGADLDQAKNKADSFTLLLDADPVNSKEEAEAHKPQFTTVRLLYHATNQIDTVTLLFKDDLENSLEEADKPPLCTNLRRLMESNSPIAGMNTYTEYAKLLVGMACMLTKVGHPSMNLLSISELHAALDEGDKLKKILKPNLHVSQLKIRGTKHRIMVTTPKQLKILKGPNRQFIFGSAGTGKTVILQEKIMQLLRNGGTVTVLARQSYAPMYQAMFDNRGFSDGHMDVKLWSSFWHRGDLSGHISGL